MVAIEILLRAANVLGMRKKVELISLVPFKKFTKKTEFDILRNLIFFVLSFGVISKST